MQRPLLTGSLFFMAGILLARFFTTRITLWLVLAGASFFVAFVGFLRKKSIRQIVPFFVMFGLVLAGAFWYSLSRDPEDLAQKDVGKIVTGVGTVASYPRENEYGISCLLTVERIAAAKDSGKITFSKRQKVVLKSLKDPALVLLPGDRVVFEGVITQPSKPHNPGQFDYGEYLANQGIFRIINCQKGELRLTEKGEGIRALAAEGRKQVVQCLNELLPQREKGLILGILFGDTTLIEEEEWDAYKQAGVVHLFAVSGLHVGIVLGFLWFLLSFFQPRPLLRLLIGTGVIIGYGFMVGWSSSILRASLMAVLGLLALTVGRKNDLYNSLGAAAWIVLLFSPGELFQAGFQFSFLTTAGLIYLTPWLERKGCGKLFSPALAAQLASTPLTAYHFNQISLIAPFVNIFAIMVSSVAAVFSFTGTLLTWILPWLATPFFLAAGFIMFCLSKLIVWCAGLKWASVVVASPSPLLLICIYLGILVLPVFTRYRYIWREVPSKIKAALVCFFTVIFLFACWPMPKGLEVVFLDVGQGDCIFMRTPGGKTVLLDGGGTPGSSYSIGRTVLRPFLYYYGVNKIDVIIMSHNHVDHSEGLLEILPYFKVGAFMMPPGEENNEMEQELRKICTQKKVPVQELTAGQKIMVEQDVLLEVLHPEQEGFFIGNNRSLVLRLNYQESSWLFTGDAEKEVLEKLLENGAKLHADLLKIPHHGSRTSFVPAFYQKVQPGAVVVSVGENRFGQPHPEVPAYFTQRGIPVYLTKERGAVFTQSNGQKMLLKTYLPTKGEKK
jgi:competence protein ComEC